MRLRGEAGTDDPFRLHSVNMGALVSDHAVGFSSDRAVAEHGNDLEGKWDADRCYRLDDPKNGDSYGEDSVS